MLANAPDIRNPLQLLAGVITESYSLGLTHSIMIPLPHSPLPTEQRTLFSLSLVTGATTKTTLSILSLQCLCKCSLDLEKEKRSESPPLFSPVAGLTVRAASCFPLSSSDLRFTLAREETEKDKKRRKILPEPENTACSLSHVFSKPVLTSACLQRLTLQPHLKRTQTCSGTLFSARPASFPASGKPA